MNTAKDKGILRNAILDRRMKLPFEDVFTMSSVIQDRLLHLKAYMLSNKIALYASFKNEVLTNNILEDAVKNNKDVYFPKVIKNKKRLCFIKVKGKEELSLGSYNIPEPIGGYKALDINDIDIAVVPGVAFDIWGNRLGYGKGYYDKLLTNLKGHAVLIGFAFDFQIVKQLPVEGHDVSMDMIVTEKRVISL